MRQMDVVIPVAPKDFFKLRRCIEGILRCSKNPIRTLSSCSSGICGRCSSFPA